MIFNSAKFLIFFPIVVVIYFIVPRKIRNYWLLIASYYFYMCWDARYAILMLFSTVVTYISGILLEKAKQSNKKTKIKKIIVAGSFILNLGILFFFKYFNFTLDILAKLFGYINIELNSPAFDILLPVGISFYTFQALSYTMDVYRNELKAEKNFFKYALFVSFFPQLVAGPIERSKNLLKELSQNRKFSFERLKEGFLLMIWGFFLKLVIADRAAIFVNTVFGDYMTYSGWYIAIAAVLFSIQVYCDFYGYSVIAMGSAKILGIDLMENFNAPYFSTSIKEFWKRWHISLSSWFKDYLYIPLGGSRKGKLRKYINTVIIFFVSGLWHGASLTYVLWGTLNGLFLVVEEIFTPVRNKLIRIFHLTKESLGHKIFQTILTFSIITLLTIIFRAKNISEAYNLFVQMFTVKNPWILFDNSLYDCGVNQKNFNLLIIGIVILFITDYCKLKGIKIRKIILKQDYWFRWAVIIFAICSILIFGIWGPGYDSSGFIYFQF